MPGTSHHMTQVATCPHLHRQNRLAGSVDPGPQLTWASPSCDVYPALDSDEDCMHTCSTIAMPLLMLATVSCHWPSLPLPLPLALTTVALAVSPALCAATVVPYAPSPLHPMHCRHCTPHPLTVTPHGYRVNCYPLQLSGPTSFIYFSLQPCGVLWTQSHTCHHHHPCVLQ